MHPRCLHGVFQVRGKEGLRAYGAVVYPNGVVSERDGHDMSDWIEDRELFLAKEVNRAMRRRQQGQREGKSRTYGLGFLSAPL
jgi:hypothetical protein